MDLGGKGHKKAKIGSMGKNCTRREKVKGDRGKGPIKKGRPLYMEGGDKGLMVKGIKG